LRIYPTLVGVGSQQPMDLEKPQAAKMGLVLKLRSDWKQMIISDKSTTIGTPKKIIRKATCVKLCEMIVR
jgi:hypothetical protein